MRIVRSALGLCLLCWSWAAAADEAGWIDFTIVGGLVVIPTEIQGIPGFSAIDTGAQFTSIERTFVEKHKLELTRGKPLPVIGINGKEVRKTYADVPVTLMGTELVFNQLVEISLDARGQLLIGGDFLKGVYVQFDYPNQRLRAIPRTAFDLKKLSNIKSKIDEKSGQPMAKVKLNGKKDLWLTIDTGNSMGVVMQRSLARKQGWLEKFSSEDIEIRGMTAKSNAEVFRLPMVEIGPFVVKNTRVTVPAEGKGFEMFQRQRGMTDWRGKTRGLLGYDVLKNFVVTFDYHTGAMFLELPKAQKPALSESQQAAGLESS